MYNGTKIQRKRVKRLVNFLKTKVPDDNFSLNSIVSTFHIPTARDWDCGTTACVTGLLPRFNPKRFRYLEKVYGIVVEDKINGLERYIDIMTSYFGFTISQAEHLFNPVYRNYSKVGLEQVAKDIEKVLKG